MKTSVTKGTLYLVVAQAVFLFVGYLVHVMLGRMLGPAAYGVFGVVLGIMNLATIIPSSGVPIAVSKFVGESEEKSGGIMREGLKLQLAICSIIFIIYFSSAAFVAATFSDPNFILYVRITSISIFLVGIGSLYYSYLSGRRYFGKQSFVYAVSSVIGLLAILLVALGFGVIGAIFSYVLSYLTLLILAFWFSGKISGDGFDWKKLLYFSTPLMVYAIFSNILQTIDLTIVEALLKNDILAGYYTAASMIGKLFYILIVTLFATLIPAISNSIARNNKKKTREYVTNSIRYAVMLLAPIAFIVSPTAVGLVSIVYSPAFAPAGGVLSIFIFGTCFFTLLMGMSNMLIACGKPKVCVWIFALSCIILIMLSLTLIPEMGIAGAALAMTASSFVGMMLAAYYVKKNFGYVTRAESLLRIFFASIVLYPAALYINLPSNWLLPLEYAALFGVYFAILLITKEVTGEDFKIVKDITPEYIKKYIS